MHGPGSTRMETYYGFVSTSDDALALFEACRLGYKQRVPRRLSDDERAAIRSGSVFVWEEAESGMKRWTDGRSWSPSRVQGCFLTYHEWQGRRRAQRHPSYHTMHGFGMPFAIQGLPPGAQPPFPTGIARYGHFIGGPTKAGSAQVQYGFPKENGMLKKALSIRTHDGKRLHIIAYYSKEDHARRRLLTPTTDPLFPRLAVPPNLYPDMSPESMYGAGHAMGQGPDDREPDYEPDHRPKSEPGDDAPSDSVDALSHGLHRARVQSLVASSSHPATAAAIQQACSRQPPLSAPSSLGIGSAGSAREHRHSKQQHNHEPPPIPASASAMPMPLALPDTAPATAVETHSAMSAMPASATAPRSRGPKHLGLGGALGLSPGPTVRRSNTARSATIGSSPFGTAPHSALPLPLLLSPVTAPPITVSATATATSFNLAAIRRDVHEGPRRLPSIAAALPPLPMSESPPPSITLPVGPPRSAAACMAGGLGIFAPAPRAASSSSLLPSPLPTPRQTVSRGFDGDRISPPTNSMVPQSARVDSLSLLASAVDRAQVRHASVSARPAANSFSNSGHHPYARNLNGRPSRLPAMRSVSLKQSEDIRQLGVLDQSLRLK
ncbi:Gluconate transport-inducing protein [Coemansia sp. Benny D115]|nr:Gluconate transport-inducing protein [Coemansia sp. Benny D115]